MWRLQINSQNTICLQLHVHKLQEINRPDRYKRNFDNYYIPTKRHCPGFSNIHTRSPRSTRTNRTKLWLMIRVVISLIKSEIADDRDKWLMLILWIWIFTRLALPLSFVNTISGFNKCMHFACIISRPTHICSVSIFIRIIKLYYK